MDSSKDQAITLFNKWRAESARIRVFIVMPPIDAIFSGIVENLEGDFLTISGSEFSLTVCLDGATFEEERKLDFPVCVQVTIKSEARLIPEHFGEVQFLICELP